MCAYELSTHLGAHLFRERHFRPNGLVGSMSLRVLHGYLDASGNASNASDRLLTVNGCLSTPEKWVAFNLEWQAALKGFGFVPEAKTGNYVFHATDYHARRCKLMPKGLTKAQYEQIYDHLLDLIVRHTLFRFGHAVDLNAFREWAAEYPYSHALVSGKPGTLLTVISVRDCLDWAEANGYSKSL